MAVCSIADVKIGRHFTTIAKMKFVLALLFLLVAVLSICLAAPKPADEESATANEPMEMSASASEKPSPYDPVKIAALQATETGRYWLGLAANLITEFINNKP